jgi:hypothetical protein
MVGEMGGNHLGQPYTTLEYPQTAGMGNGLSRCGRIQHCTHTCDTRDRNTAGKPVPMNNPKPEDLGHNAVDSRVSSVLTTSFSGIDEPLTMTCDVGEMDMARDGMRTKECQNEWVFGCWACWEGKCWGYSTDGGLGVTISACGMPVPSYQQWCG